MAQKTRKPPGQNVKITKDAWYAEVVGDPAKGPQPERLKGRQLDLLHAMEEGGPDAIRPLVESWGLVWKVGPRGGITVDVPE
ncbi:hypothetical protein [Streptomyces griseus]|uniref:hypothetical protein n=1 Tax=Streptomyces griseus TaxID=1911 RepID=UPI0037B8093F